MEPCNSALLSSQKSSVRLSGWLTIGIGGFLLSCHRAVTPAISFESVLRVTVESMQGSHVSQECIGMSVVF